MAASSSSNIDPSVGSINSSLATPPSLYLVCQWTGCHTAPADTWKEQWEHLMGHAARQSDRPEGDIGCVKSANRHAIGLPGSSSWIISRSTANTSPTLASVNVPSRARRRWKSIGRHARNRQNTLAYDSPLKELRQWSVIRLFLPLSHLVQGHPSRHYCSSSWTQPCRIELRQCQYGSTP